MTDAQISLYAALRVAVPGEWRICGHSFKLDAWRSEPWMGNQFVFFERPVYTHADLSIGRFFRTPVKRLVGTEKLSIWLDWPTLEREPGQAIRRAVWQAEEVLELDR